MTKDFEIIESTRRSAVRPSFKVDKLSDALTDNMDSIVGIVKDIAEIQKMKIQSEAVLAKMEADRKMLIAETNAYVERKNTDTKNAIDKMKVIQEILRDFYSYNQQGEAGLSADALSTIISDTLK